MLQQLVQDRQDPLDETLSEEVPQHGECGHYHKGVFRVEVLLDGVVHEQTHLLSRLDEHGCQEVGHLLQVETG